MRKKSFIILIFEMYLRKKFNRHVTNAYMKIKKLRRNRTNINIFVTTVAIVMIWR
jgi:uncharacterized membrane protein YobD (UPF0266 family)